MNKINIYELQNKNILINSHSNLLYTAGDTVMLSNYINLFIKNSNNVTFLTKHFITDIFIRNIENKEKLKVIDGRNNKKIIEYIDNKENNFDVIFIRNHEIISLLKDKKYLDKTILYVLDPHLEVINLLENKFNSVITQSQQFKQKCIEHNIYENKIVIKEPIAYKYNFDLPERKDKEIRLIYSGTLREEENILEIIEEFKKIKKQITVIKVTLKIVYGKIYSTDEFTKKINKIIDEGVDGIIFLHNLSHRDSCYEIATSDIGICWRKNGWGDNGEISTKIKEYKMYGLSICYNMNFSSV